MAKQDLQTLVHSTHKSIIFLHFQKTNGNFATAITTTTAATATTVPRMLLLCEVIFYQYG